MAFTNLWSVVIPAGGTQAKLIDDHIRQLRLDLDERLEATLVQDMSADPLVLRDDIKGKKTDKKLVIGFAEFAKSTLGKEHVIDTYKLIAFTDSSVVIYPIKLPPGVTLKRIEFMSDRNTAGSIVFELRKRAFAGGGATDTNTLVATVTNNSAAAGTDVRAPADFVEVIDGNTMYYVTIEGTGTAGNAFYIFGIRLTYDAPSSNETI